MGILRLLLAISVIMIHTSGIFGINIVGGQIAVELFYIISGFYMSLVLNEKYIGGNNSYKLFLSNRLLKLYPVYWAVLLFTLALFSYSFFRGHEIGNTLGKFIEYGHTMSAGSFVFMIVTNIVLLGQDAVMFLGLNTHTGSLFYTPDFHATTPALYTFLFVPQAWSLGVEISYYLVAPFIVRKKLQVVGLLAVISIIIRLCLVHNGLYNDPWSYRFFPTELLFFLLGNISYRLYKKIEFKEINRRYLFLITAFILLYTLFYLKIQFMYSLYIYIALFVAALPFIFIYTKRNKADAKIAELSYPVYISHMFIVYLVQIAGNHFSSIYHFGSGLPVTFFSILFSVFLVKAIVEPIEKIRQKRVRKVSISQEAATL